MKKIVLILLSAAALAQADIVNPQAAFGNAPLPPTTVYKWYTDKNVFFGAHPPKNVYKTIEFEVAPGYPKRSSKGNILLWQLTESNGSILYIAGSAKDYDLYINLYKNHGASTKVSLKLKGFILDEQITLGYLSTKELQQDVADAQTYIKEAMRNKKIIVFVE